MISGEMEHKDSAGNSGVLRDGCVQWMTAGSGVVHTEMPSKEVLERGGRMEGFQLWVNLPAREKMIPPRYQDTPAERIPVVTEQGGRVWVKVIAGESLGKRAVIETRTPIMFLDVRLQPRAVFTQPVPQDFEGFAYVWKGSGYLGQGREPAKFGQAAIMDDGEEFRIEAAAEEAVHVLLIAGKPLRESVVAHGTFVMNTMEEIEQAMADYQSGKLGSVEGAEERYRITAAAREKSKR